MQDPKREVQGVQHLPEIMSTKHDKEFDGQAVHTSKALKDKISSHVW